MFTASADNLFAAISNEVRVRVEGSKKRLITVHPRSAGTFLISRLETSRNDSAVSSRCVICSAESSRIPSRCLILKLTLTSQPLSKLDQLSTTKTPEIGQYVLIQFFKHRQKVCS